MHYRRVRKRGTSALVVVNEVERFWSHVILGEDCWEWRDATTYAFFGGKGAHRYSWELEYGPVGDSKLFVCHHCDNPPCVRPSHLFLGTPGDNSADMVSKGRQSRRGNPTLTWDQVDQIRAELSTGATRYDLAPKYGVTAAMIWRIDNGLSWDPAMRRPMDT